MRIIRGKYRGRQIIPPANLPVRPTTDYAKEGIFNVLEHTFEFEELEVLDLFAGTGSISLEFLSRGCQSVTAVELNAKCVEFIRETAREFRFDKFRIIRADVPKFIRGNHNRFSIIFADPPYDLELLPELPGMILNERMLYDDGWFILEHSSNYDFSNSPYFMQHRKYGEVNFSIFCFSTSGQ